MTGPQALGIVIVAIVVGIPCVFAIVGVLRIRAEHRAYMARLEDFKRRALEAREARRA